MIEFLTKNYFCTGGGEYDCSIKLWNLRKFTCKKIIGYHERWIWNLKKLDFKRLVSSSKTDGSIKIWNYI